MTTSAKNNIAQCKSRTRIYENLVSECEKMGFEYNLNKSFSHNAGRARDRMMWSVSEVILHGEKIEGGL